VGQSSGYLAATWSMPADMENDFIEIASSPAVYSDGAFRGEFLEENTVLFDDSLEAKQDAYEAPDQLPPGTYYVHVAAFAPAGCPTQDAPTCVDEFSATVPVTVPDPNAPQPPPPPPPPPDTVTAFATLSVPASQKVGRLYVRASMGEAGTISAEGTVGVPKLSKVYRFKTVSMNVVAGVSVKLALKLPKKALKAVRKALKRHGKVMAKVAVKATDKAGNTKTEQRTIKLKP
jgi:hypothetical protein